MSESEARWGPAGARSAESPPAGQGAGGHGPRDDTVHLDDLVLTGEVAGTELVAARPGAGGPPVLLERSEPVDPAAGAELRVAATRWRRVSSPHLLRPRAVLAGAVETVVVLDGGPVRSLAALVERRGTLDAGEVVTVGVALGRAAATAHSGGLLLGEVSASRVLLTADGMPVLAVTAAALRASAAVPGTPVRPESGAVDEAARPEADEPGPEASPGRRSVADAPHEAAGQVPDGPGGDVADGQAKDVAAVADLCASLLGSQPPAALVDVLDRAVALDPAQRPDGRTLAALLQRACPPEPVRLDDGSAAAPSEVPPASGRTDVGRHSVGATSAGPRVPGGAALGLVLLVAAGAGAGWLSGRGDEPASAPAPAPRWSVVLDRLDAARAEAFAAADERTLDRVYAPVAPGLAQDRQQVRALAAARRTAHGVRHSVREVEVLTAGQERVRLRVVDVLQAYEVRDATGAVVAAAPGRGEVSHLVELSRTAAGWRLLEVAREPEPVR